MKKGLSDAEYRGLAQLFAGYHYNLPKDNIDAIYLSPDPDKLELRLLEVSRTGVTTHRQGEVFSIGFGPSPREKLPIPMRVALVNQEEWELLGKNELSLPEGWSSLEDKPLPRHGACVSA